MRPAQLLMAVSALAGVIATPVETSTDIDWEAVADRIAAKHGIKVVDQPADEISTQATDCYGNGVKWDSDDKNAALNQAAQWCARVNPGTYRAGQTKWHCYKFYQGLASRRNVFGIKNEQGKSSDLSIDACYSFFRGLINACPQRGGTNSNGAWWWRCVFFPRKSKMVDISTTCMSLIHAAVLILRTGLVMTALGHRCHNAKYKVEKQPHSLDGKTTQDREKKT